MASERNVGNYSKRGTQDDSILPSLGSKQSSHAGSPIPAENSRSGDEQALSSPADFFQVRKAGYQNEFTKAVDDKLDRLGPHLVQPRSRFSNVPFRSLVVDPKKEIDDEGLPSISVNTSSTNLKGLASQSSSSLANTRPSHVAAKISQPNVSSRLNKGFSKFDLEANDDLNFLPGSTLRNHEGYSSDSLDDLDYSSQGMSESRMAPYGGFSRPNLKEQILNEDSFFETAPWKVVESGKGNGSLIKAVQSSIDQGIIGQCKWVGTMSMPSDSISDRVLGNISKTLSKDYNCEPVFPSDLVFNGFYKSYCKQILWPTFHYQIPDDPKSKAFEDHSWGYYKQVNQMVADKVVETFLKECKDDDSSDPRNLVWIHDYHLLLVPRMVREKLPNTKIGFFLHISFPSSEVFRCFAQREELLKGMLGANCVSFQTHEYVRHFATTCNGLLLADVNEYGISYNGNISMTATIPVGVDAKALSHTLTTASVAEWRKQIRNRWKDKKLIVSRDSMDRIRGIKQKLLAYEKFLHANPEYIETAVLIQICPNVPQDKVYESDVLSIAGRINGLTEEMSFSQPVILLEQDIGFEQYIALQCEADLFVVASMREGLNLTCHEYIIATTEKKSPLMLSEFTGSSTLLECGGEGALLINPWDLKKFAETFKILLEMGFDERLRRWKNCYNVIISHDSKNWLIKCLGAISSAWEYNRTRSLNTLKPFTEEIFEKFYESAEGKRIFVLNLETPSAIRSVNDSDISQSGKSTISVEPSKLALLLNELLSDPLNHVYIISFMRRSDLDILFKRMPSLGLIAENGGYIKLVGSSKWISIVDELELRAWMPQVGQLIKAKMDRLPGSQMDIEDCTIRFYAGEAYNEDRERALGVMGGSMQHINDMDLNNGGVHATLIKHVLVVQQDKLTLKALQFLVSYYNHKYEGVTSELLVQQFLAKQVKTTNSVPTTPLSEHLGEILSPRSQSTNGNAIGALFVSGGSTPIDEPSYEYANQLHEDGTILNVLTVSAASNDSSTSANYSTSGRNKVLVIMSDIGKKYEVK